MKFKLLENNRLYIKVRQFMTICLKDFCIKYAWKYGTCVEYL
jgi:hypothetical protein